MSSATRAATAGGPGPAGGFLARGRRTTPVEVGTALVGGSAGGWLLVETGESSPSSVVPRMVLAAALLLPVSPHLHGLTIPGAVPIPSSCWHCT